MTLTKKQGEELFRKATLHTFYKHICEHCNEQLVVDLDDCERILFEPKEVEEEYMTFNDKKIEHHTRMVMRSSDPTKDTYKFVCPACGEVIIVNAKELTNEHCAMDGVEHELFILDEQETNDAKEFIKSHMHKDEFEKQNKLGFSTLGQQFTYEITPGGLGCCVTIICNQCHEFKDITNSDNW